MHTQLFSIAVDVSNDTGLVKMNPLTVRLYDVSEGSIVTRFLDMGLTKGHIVHHVNWGTNLSLFSAFLWHRYTVCDCKIYFWKDWWHFWSNILWSSCDGMSFDNTSVNIGRINSIMTRGSPQKSCTIFYGLPMSYDTQHMYEGCREFCKGWLGYLVLAQKLNKIYDNIL